MSEEVILQKHNEILNDLLEYKKNNPEFTFATRVNNRNNRIEQGYWFLGNETYIFVPLYKVGDDDNKTKTIGFVYTEDSQYIEIVFRSIRGVAENEEEMYRELIQILSSRTDILNRKDIGEQKKFFYFHENDLKKNLDYFIHKFKKICDEIITKFGLEEKYFIKEVEFQNNIERLNLDKTMSKPKDKKMPNTTKLPKSLNQILYGPPGTGKTYNTINKALEIIDGEVPSARSEAKQRFEELKLSGQIEFVTFHQSYGYEEFVEGIKAKTTDKGIEYKIEDGIFKKLCEKAQNKKIFYIGQEIGKYQIVGLTDELMKLKRENGSLIPIPMYLLNEVLDLVNKKIISIADLNNKVAIEKMSSETEKFIINGYPNIFRDLAQYYIDNKYLVDHRTQNYILIIDEINRGNISKIFGELITLIEPSKRIGAEEEIKLRLPYSADEFGVPQNLYIIGTMNTADRSIALMDTALRRRFEFVEMMPKAELLDFKVDGINIKSMFEKINKRVEYLYDRDHTIGHAYFMSLKDNPSIDELNNIFRNKIIPLLQEYFYDDWEKIRMVLGDGFIKRTKTSSDIFDDEFKQTDYIEDEKFVYEIVQDFDYSSF